MTVDEAQDLCKNNLTIFDSFEKAKSVLSKYNRIMCSISGGKDSDIVLDLIHKVDVEHKVRYVWFDTGVEYQATKKHLDYLEEKYEIDIERYKAIKTVPISVKEYGQPFLSKQVSQLIYALQHHNFQWEDGSYEELNRKYPKCKKALAWWCNIHPDLPNYPSKFNINYNGKYLKQFLMFTPPHSKFRTNAAPMQKKRLPSNTIKIMLSS